MLRVQPYTVSYRTAEGTALNMRWALQADLPHDCSKSRAGCSNISLVGGTCASVKGGCWLNWISFCSIDASGAGTSRTKVITAYTVPRTEYNFTLETDNPQRIPSPRYHLFLMLKTAGCCVCDQMMSLVKHEGLFDFPVTIKRSAMRTLLYPTPPQNPSLLIKQDVLPPSCIMK